MQRMIDTGTWDDPWFADLDPDAKLLFLYFLTNRRSTAAGAFEITIRAIAFETGLSPERIETALAKFGERVRWWPEHQVIWVRNFFKRQAANDNFIKSAQKFIADLPLDVQREIGSVYPNLVSPEVSAAKFRTEMGSGTTGEPMPMGTDTPPVVESSNRGSSRGEGNGADAPALPSSPKPAPKPRATRLPDDFAVTEDMRAWAREAGAPDRLIESETDKFRDYWSGIAGQRGTKLDWPATWRNWIRRALDSAPAGSFRVVNGSKPPAGDFEIPDDLFGQERLDYARRMVAERKHA